MVASGSQSHLAQTVESATFVVTVLSKPESMQIRLVLSVDVKLGQVGRLSGLVRLAKHQAPS